WRYRERAVAVPLHRRARPQRPDRGDQPRHPRGRPRPGRQRAPAPAAPAPGRRQLPRGRGRHRPGRGQPEVSTPDATATRAYLQRLGLERSPFPTTPDAENYFSTGPIEGELAEAVHCVLARKGFVLLTGDVGTGKSTFLRRLLDEVEDRGAIVSLLFNTFLQGPDLLAAICRDFGVKAGTDAAANLDALNRFLLRCWHDGRTCVLVIDDAQNLDVASLELLRLLSNLESGQEKLLQIVLAGQTELVATL